MEIGGPRRTRSVYALDLSKRVVRPIPPDAGVYRHRPVLRHVRPHPWCVLEYAATDESREVADTFRRTAQDDGRYRCRPRGLRQGARSRMAFDNTGDVAELSWLELHRDGLEVRLESSLTSELPTIEQA